jgi:hypothetical protein
MDGFFWPVQNLNTLGAWDYTRGYLIKMNEASTISIAGHPIGSDVINLQAGWNLIPVLCKNGISCNEVLEQLGENLIIIKEPATTGVFWPELGIDTLGELNRGKAYFVLVNSAAQLTFED